MQQMVPAWTEKFKVIVGKIHQAALIAYNVTLRRHSTMGSDSDSPQCCSLRSTLQGGAGQQSAGMAVGLGSQAGLPWESGFASGRCCGDHIMIGN